MNEPDYTDGIKAATLQESQPTGVEDTTAIQLAQSRAAF